jgi:hypothetical protein
MPSGKTKTGKAIFSLLVLLFSKEFPNFGFSALFVHHFVWVIFLVEVCQSNGILVLWVIRNDLLFACKQKECRIECAGERNDSSSINIYLVNELIEDWLNLRASAKTTGLITTKIATIELALHASHEATILCFFLN